VGDQHLEIEVDQPMALALAPQIESEQRSPVKAIHNQIKVPPKAQPPKPPSRRTSFDQPQSPPPQFNFTPARPAPNNRITLYLIVAILCGGLYWFLGPSKSKNTGQELRTESDFLQDIQATDERIQELEKEQTKKGQDTIQYKTAEQHYIKGFRDYRNGQFARAIQSFQAALSFYPGHELSQKYRDLSIRKFDEQVQQNMMVGRRYKGKGNYRLCQSNFAAAMIMLKDPNDRKYVEAKKSYEECRLLDGDR
jgi:tetratricopeptide (TPR) repeat protein